MPNYSKALKYGKKQYKRGRRAAYSRYKNDQIVKDVMYLKKLVNIEVKHFDTIQNNISLSTVPIIVSLNEIAQGLTDTNRVGNSIKIQSIQVFGKITQSSAATDTTFRIMVGSSNIAEANPTATDILDNTGNNMIVVSPYLLNRTATFNVKLDKSKVLCSNGTTERYFKYFLPVTNHHVKFDGSGAGVASVTGGNLWSMVFCDETTNLPKLNCFYRIRYTDN